MNNNQIAQLVIGLGLMTPALIIAYRVALGGTTQTAGVWLAGILAFFGLLFVISAFSTKEGK